MKFSYFLKIFSAFIIILNLTSAVLFSQQTNLKSFEGSWIGITESGDSLIVKLELNTDYYEHVNKSLSFLNGTVSFKSNSSLQIEGGGNNLQKGRLTRDESGNEVIVFIYKDYDRLKHGNLIFNISTENKNTITWRLESYEGYSYESKGKKIGGGRFSIPSEITLNRISF